MPATPMPAPAPAPEAAEAVVAELVAHAAALHAAGGGDLLGSFAAVPDPRARRGVWHSLVSVLAMCTAAVLCGCTSLADVTAWVSSADRRVLAGRAGVPPQRPGDPHPAAPGDGHPGEHILGAAALSRFQVRAGIFVTKLAMMPIKNRVTSALPRRRSFYCGALDVAAQTGITLKEIVRRTGPDLLK